MKEVFHVYFSSKAVENETTLRFTYQIGNGKPEESQGSDNYVKPLPDIVVKANTRVGKQVVISGNNPGHLVIGLESNSTEFEEYVPSAFFI